MSLPDWRLHPYRSDLAAAQMRGLVDAPRYVEGAPAHVAIPSVLVRRTPEDFGVVDSELLFGEEVSVFEDLHGWSWVQNRSDRYVGYVRSEALRPGATRTTHCVGVARTCLLPEPTIKKGDTGILSLNAQVCVEEQEGDFARLADGAGYVFAAHLLQHGSYLGDFVEVASMFLHGPYRWGGRSSIGLDCSGLVQMSLTACGIDCPRDSDMQEQILGQQIQAEPAALQRGDLVFWKGHVGIVSAPGRLLHATGHFMRVVDEPLQTAIARIAGQGLEITSIRRIDQ